MKWIREYSHQKATLRQSPSQLRLEFYSVRQRTYKNKCQWIICTARPKDISIHRPRQGTYIIWDKRHRRKISHSKHLCSLTLGNLITNVYESVTEERVPWYCHSAPSWGRWAVGKCCLHSILPLQFFCNDIWNGNNFLSCGTQLQQEVFKNISSTQSVNMLIDVCDIN